MSLEGNIGIEVLLSNRQTYKPLGGNIGVEVLTSNRQIFKPMQGSIGVELLLSGIKILVVQDQSGNTLYSIPLLVEDINEVDPPQNLYTNSLGYVYLGSDYSTDIRVTIVNQIGWLDEIIEIDTSPKDYYVITLIKAPYYRIRKVGTTQWSSVVKTSKP